MTRRLPAWSRSLLVLVVLAAACRSQDAPPGDETPGEAATEVSVTVAPVVRTALHGFVTGWGRVAPESATAGRPPAQAAVASPVAGLIAAIQCTEGQRVQQGATLFRLDSRVVDVSIQRARQAVDYAASVVQRQEQLGPGEATSQKAYQGARQQLADAQAELDAANVQRQFLEVKAPIDGTVVRLDARLGDTIDPSTVLAAIIDLDRLVVDAAVRSADVGRVERGQRMDLSPGASPGASADAGEAGPIEATVEYIGAQVDPATDTVLVRARIPAASGLRAGQFVDARILTEERPDRLAVPVDSVVQGSEGPEVALVDGQTAVRTAVTTGLTDGGLVEVEGAGVREGATVVVEGAYGLPSRTRVRVIGQ